MQVMHMLIVVLSLHSFGVYTANFLLQYYLHQ